PRGCAVGRPAPLSRCSAALSPARSLAEGRMKRCRRCRPCCYTLGGRACSHLLWTACPLLACSGFRWSSKTRDSGLPHPRGVSCCCRTTLLAHRWYRPAGGSALPPLLFCCLAIALARDSGLLSLALLEVALHRAGESPQLL